ncbi:MAG: FAD-dependent oxidoreductase [Candidatus Lokiarchaeota archaeon]|nr:FAD-dependent oxidoreductase [Candidatus Lokiarchaeota archaeon]
MSFSLLKEEVIDIGLCQGCAKCAGTCKHIEMVDLKPQLKDACILEEKGIDCGMCYRTCPQVIQKPFTEIEKQPLEVFSLRAKDMAAGSKAGGAVTALAKMMLGEGDVSHMIMVRDDDGKPVADVITDPGKVNTYAGVTLGRSGILEKLVKTLGEPNDGIGIVAVPCEIRGTGEIEKRMGVEILKTALFCNSQMRSDRTDLGDTVSPCATNCPAGVNARDYTALIKEGRFQEAIDLIREDNPLPSVCGRICTHECEHGCTLMGASTPIAVRELKKFVSEWEMKNAPKIDALKAKPRPAGKKVAIIGGGPAGLTCAYYLARLGYRATIFEKTAKLGGMLKAGVPSFRLPDEVLDYDVDTIKALGVDVKLETPIGKNLTIDALKAQGFEAFFIGVGQWQPRTLKTPGEDLPGVHTAIDFLLNRKYRYWEKKDEFKDKTVYILGGGPVGVDVAQTALRLGAKKAYLAEIRTEAELKIVVDDIPENERKYIEYLYSTNTVKFEKNGNGTLKVAIHNVGPAPPYQKVEGTDRELQVDAVVIAIGQATDWAEIDAATGGQIKKDRGKVIIDELTFETSMPGVFAGGDIVVRGKAVAIAAVAHGREAAVSIDRYLRKVDLREGRIKKDRSFFTKPLMPPKRYSVKLDTMKGQTEDLYLDWNEIDGLFTAEAAIGEAKRCLACNNFCSHCQDFAGVLADISAGEIGSDPGYTTVLAWTENGRQIVHKALDKGLFDTGKVNMDAVNAHILRKSTREMWSFEKPLRQKVLELVVDKGPATVAKISTALGVKPIDVRYEALRLVQERQLSMKVVEGKTEPEFDIYCEE